MPNIMSRPCNPPLKKPCQRHLPFPTPHTPCPCWSHLTVSEFIKNHFSDPKQLGGSLRPVKFLDMETEQEWGTCVLGSVGPRRMALGSQASMGGAARVTPPPPSTGALSLLWCPISVQCRSLANAAKTEPASRCQLHFDRLLFI